MAHGQGFQKLTKGPGDAGRAQGGNGESLPRAACFVSFVALVGFVLATGGTRRRETIGREGHTD